MIINRRDIFAKLFFLYFIDFIFFFLTNFNRFILLIINYPIIILILSIFKNQLRLKWKIIIFFQSPLTSPKIKLCLPSNVVVGGVNLGNLWLSYLCLRCLWLSYLWLNFRPLLSLPQRPITILFPYFNTTTALARSNAQGDKSKNPIFHLTLSLPDQEVFPENIYLFTNGFKERICLYLLGLRSATKSQISSGLAFPGAT